MDVEENFRRAGERYEKAGAALRSIIEELEISSNEMERKLAGALRTSPERVQLLNLPVSTGVGIEALHDPIMVFDARNWQKGPKVADTILAFSDARRNYERSYTALPVSDRPSMKVPADLIDKVS